MNGFLYTITLEEPVLANSLGGEPNSARSLFYIPGGLVRGAVINTYGDADADYDNFHNLFFNRETRFLNAYPLINGERALPIPLIYKYKKPKYLDGGNMGKLGSTNINALEEVWQINIHTQRDAEKGRSTTEAGAVYRYIALPAGMKFQGAVISKDGKKIKDLLDGQKTILLGKARTAGYGRATVTTQDLPSNWREELGEAPTTDVKEFTIVLLSPALVRNENGQFTLDVRTALDKRLEDKKNNTKYKITNIEATCKPEIIGGFNRKWGLPLPQATAIAAGSVFRITLDNDITVKKLKTLEETGIGERRAEGFGSLVIVKSLPDINAEDEEHWKKITPSTDKPSTDGNHLSSEEHQLVNLMLTRLLRRDLDQLIVTKAREMAAEYKKDSVANSQLSRWRILFRDVIGRIAQASFSKPEDEEKFLMEQSDRVRNFHENEKKKGSSAWKQMERARVNLAGGPNRLTDWIESVLKEPEEVNKILEGADALQLAIGSDSDKSSAELRDKLKAEYRLRFMDAVFSMMSKINSGKGEQNG